MMQNRDAISDQQVHVVAVSDDGNIQALIKTIRGVQVILDRDVAGLYGVATGALNRQVKRNEERFPEDFMFKLSAEEWNNLKCQIGISSWGGDRQLPYAFTENGIAMLSGVLRSPTAIEVNIRIMRAFSAMRRFLLANAQMFQRIETVEKRQIATDAKVDSILERLDATETPLQGVFYDGQLWDADEIRRIRKAAFEMGYCCKYRKGACRDVKTVIPRFHLLDQHDGFDKAVSYARVLDMLGQIP